MNFQPKPQSCIVLLLLWKQPLTPRNFWWKHPLFGHFQSTQTPLLLTLSYLLFYLQILDLDLYFHLISDDRNIPKFVSLGLWMHYYCWPRMYEKRNMVTERGGRRNLDEVETKRFMTIFFFKVSSKNFFEQI